MALISAAASATRGTSGLPTPCVAGGCVSMGASCWRRALPWEREDGDEEVVNWWACVQRNPDNSKHVRSVVFWTG